jgi:non-ribosomal peptide synthetase component F/thioesterase domain-containing protein/acyl carrier protein
MKPIEEFLFDLNHLDIKIWDDDGHLGYDAPKGRLTPALRAELIERKQEMLSFLRQLKLASASKLAPIKPVSRQGKLPLSFAQQRLWFLNQWEPDNPFYNESIGVRLKGLLNISALEQSLNEIVRRHEALRTNFTCIEGEPTQAIAPSLPLSLTVVNLQEIPECECEAEALRLASKAVSSSFNLAEGALLRATLLQLSKTEHIILLTIHHIVCDGWSMAVLIREIAVLYTAFCSGKPSPLPELPIQYADFANWQRQCLTGDFLQSHLSYWLKQLSNYPPLLQLPTNRPRLAIQSFRGATQSFSLSTDLTEALKELSQQAGTTLFMTLLAAFKTLLYRYSGQEDILVGSAIANRNRTDLEGLIGLFANTLVLRTNLTDNLSFRELLYQVRECTLSAYTHQDLPFEYLVEKLQPERNPSYNPLFQVMFVLQNSPTEKLKLPSLNLSFLKLENQTAKFDLSLSMADNESGLEGSLEYNSDLFDADTIYRMVEHLRILLTGIINNPEQRLCDLPLLSAAEQQQLLVLWNNTKVDYPEDICIHELFEAQVERTPDAIALIARSANAVVFEDQQLIYQQLNHQANQLAHYLQELGVGPEVLVGIYIERSLEMFISILAILKAGGAYLPLDPSHPQERLALMLEDAKPLVLITQTQLVAKLPQHKARIICLNADLASQFSQHSQQNPISKARPDNLAYVIYTSGSTGIPKGVMVTHQALVNHSIAAAKAYKLQPDDRILQFAAISFDVSAEELFPSWLSGSTVVIRPDRVLSLADFQQFLEQEKITVLNLPTAYWHQWVSELSDTKAALPSTLRLVIVGTEQVKSEKLALWQKLVKSAEFRVLSAELKDRPQGTGYQSSPEWMISPTRSGAFTECESTEYSCSYSALNTQHSILSKVNNSVRWINAYGPTEATIGATIYEPVNGQENLELSSVPIGRPIDNTQIYLLDKHLNPTPIGVPGELYIGGISLARGYLNRPDLTAEKFIPDPFCNQAQTRLYRTGDLARYLANGDLEYLGRVDNQVKVRGFRIELEEIEIALAQYPAVRETIVLAQETQAGDQQLIAYIVSNKEQLTTRELRNFLKQQLPEYMIPSAFVLLETLPQMPSGKVDRQALSALETKRPNFQKDYVAPRDILELQLTEIWEELLGVSPIGVTDNFFELGGHSLLAVRLMAKIQKQFGCSLPLFSLFQESTIENFKSLLSQKIHSPQNPSPLVAIQPYGHKKPLFFIHPVGGSVFCYYELARCLGLDQPFYGLRSLGLYGECEPYTCIEDMASHYIAALRLVQPQGPYLLGGWSMGGVVAFEMAIQLERQGQKVALLALLDSQAPIKINQSTGFNDHDDVEVLVNLAQDIACSTGKLSSVSDNLSALHETLRQLQPEEQLSYFLEQMKMANLIPPDIEHYQLHCLLQVFKNNIQALNKYTPQVCCNQITLFRGSNIVDHELDSLTLGWDQLSSEPVKIIAVPGNHYTMLAKPHIHNLQEKLKEYLVDT